MKIADKSETVLFSNSAGGEGTAVCIPPKSEVFQVCLTRVVAQFLIHVENGEQ